MTKNGLIVFAREPLAGRVKTRLAARIGEEVAAELYEAMLQDVLSVCSQLKEIDTVVFWDCAEESLPLLAKRYGYHSRRQTDGDLGQRMKNAFRAMFDNGYEECCIIGSDCPDLPTDRLKTAYDLLGSKQADAVFGPSTDGGYYLLGLRRMIPELFENISWSTELVFMESLEAAQNAGVMTSLLKTWQDIDTLEDLDFFLKRTNPPAAAGSKTAELANRLRLVEWHA